jgi:hypothetical protein
VYQQISLAGMSQFCAKYPADLLVVSLVFVLYRFPTAVETKRDCDNGALATGALSTALLREIRQPSKQASNKLTRSRN